MIFGHLVLAFGFLAVEDDVERDIEILIMDRILKISKPYKKSKATPSEVALPLGGLVAPRLLPR